MRSPNKLLASSLSCPTACFAGTFVVPPRRTWPVAGDPLFRRTRARHADRAADIYVAPLNAPASPDWRAKVMRGAALILEGTSPLAVQFRFHATAANGFHYPHR